MPNPGHPSYQSIIPLDASRPTEFIITERNARTCWQEVFADLLSDNFLNHDSHFFMEMKQSTFGAVLRGMLARRIEA